MTPDTLLTDDEITNALKSITHDVKRLPPGFRKFARAIEQAILQSPQVQQWKKDAARFTWLRDTCGIVEYKRWFGSIGPGMLPSGQRLEITIDTAMEAKDE